MRKIFTFIMPFVMLVIFFWALWYTAHRLHVHFGGVSFWVYQAAVAVIIFGSLAILSLANRFPTPFMRAVNIVAGYVAMFVTFTGIMLLLVNLAIFIWDIPLLAGGFAALIGAFIIVTFGAAMGNMFTIPQTTIKIPGLTNSLTVMQISDAHIGLLYGSKYLTKIVDAINRKAPDFVVITGDLTETKAALAGGVLDPLAKLNAPTFFVEGNHDHYTGIDAVIAKLRSLNVRTLHNEVVETHGIQLLGIDYLKADNHAFDMHAKANKKTVQSVLSNMALNKDMPAVLLLHNPTGIPYAQAAGVDLVVSGHTHRGQIFPFSLVGKLIFPYNSGLYRYKNMQVFVSSGVGGVMARMRLGSFNEINLLRLVPEGE
ncbi:MAG: metallophosphoesterase [Defluviitaleaceae bacterium]|nr:metallophosphoesterase [Defluviitaleaceae bacterium]